MRPVLRLAINSLVVRRSRTALLIAAVALATTLVSAIACALASLNAGVAWRVETSVGKADLRVVHVGESRFDAGILDLVVAQPETRVAVGRSRGPVPLRLARTGAQRTAVGVGIDPVRDPRFQRQDLDAGRPVAAAGEIVLDAPLAADLGATVGDVLEIVRFGDPMELEIVGIAARKEIEILAKPGATVARETLAEVTGRRDRLSEIRVLLVDDADAEAVAARWSGLVPEGIVVETTARVTSGLNRTIRANGLLYVLVSVLAFIASSFIVLTGMTTNVLDRQRELALLRCIGARRGQLAASQLVIGGLLGAGGAAIGLPAGIVLAWILTMVFPERLPAGLHVSAIGFIMSTAGPIGSGLAGAAWPAVMAARSRPLEAMRVRAQRVPVRAIVLTGVIGALGIGSQLLFLGTVEDRTVAFYGQAFAGLPSMFLGYFLVGVPLVVLVSAAFGPGLERLLALPRGIARRTVAAAPFRHGFTAGALMVGLGIMIGIWTTGTGVLRDWLGGIEFPEAFVHGWLGLTPEDQEAIERLEFVDGTCAITLFKVESDAFTTAITQPKTTFVAFEPGPFFAMTKLHWIAGDPEYAQRRLAEGGAIMVAREFLVARDDYEVGDTLTVEHQGEPHEFEIVAAVTSPGLDIVSKYFDIGKEQANHALHSIFGSRADLQAKFGNDAIHLLQIGIADDLEMTDAEITDAIRAELGNRPLVVGSGRSIKEGIAEIGRGSMRIATMIALAAMLIGGLGVGNVVVAGIDARRFELGVLRAVGGSGWTVTRLLLAEVLLIALTACILGTLFGTHASWSEMRMYRLLAGLELSLRPPVGAIALGWAMLTTLTLGIVLPVVLRVTRAPARALLFSTRG